MVKGIIILVLVRPHTIYFLLRLKAKVGISKNAKGVPIFHAQTLILHACRIYKLKC